MVFTFSQCAFECTLMDINIINFIVFTFTMWVFLGQVTRTFCLSHKAERRLVFNVCQTRFVVQFSGVFRGPDLGSTDDILFPELLFIRPGQRVTGQGRQAIIGVAGGGRS